MRFCIVPVQLAMGCNCFLEIFFCCAILPSFTTKWRVESGLLRSVRHSRTTMNLMAVHLAVLRGWKASFPNPFPIASGYGGWRSWWRLEVTTNCFDVFIIIVQLPGYSCLSLSLFLTLFLHHDSLLDFFSPSFFPVPLSFVKSSTRFKLILGKTLGKV